MCIYVCTCNIGDWIRERFEPPDARKLTDEQRKKLLERLIRSTMYTYVLHVYIHVMTFVC